ncbi:hypothetical protein [Streptomyces sp. NPDC005407]
MSAACDADKPAVGALLRWFAEGGGRDTMAEHGWFSQESPTVEP